VRVAAGLRNCAAAADPVCLGAQVSIEPAQFLLRIVELDFVQQRTRLADFAAAQLLLRDAQHGASRNRFCLRRYLEFTAAELISDLVSRFGLRQIAALGGKISPANRCQPQRRVLQAAKRFENLFVPFVRVFGLFELTMKHPRRGQVQCDLGVAETVEFRQDLVDQRQRVRLASESSQGFGLNRV
jgi:hypothetical protein